MFALNVRSVIAASAVCACLSAVPCRADEYSWQLSGTTTRFERAGAHTDASSLGATYYVNPLDDSGGPLALATFLHPTTRLSATASGEEGGEPKGYILDGRYVLPGAQWYA